MFVFLADRRCRKTSRTIAIPSWIQSPWRHGCHHSGQFASFVVLMEQMPQVVFSFFISEAIARSRDVAGSPTCCTHIGTSCGGDCASLRYVFLSLDVTSTLHKLWCENTVCWFTCTTPLMIMRNAFMETGFAICGSR